MKQSQNAFKLFFWVRLLGELELKNYFSKRKKYVLCKEQTRPYYRIPPAHISISALLHLDFGLDTALSNIVNPQQIQIRPLLHFLTLLLFFLRFEIPINSPGKPEIATSVFSSIYSPKHSRFDSLHTLLSHGRRRKLQSPHCWRGFQRFQRPQSWHDQSPNYRFSFVFYFLIWVWIWIWICFWNGLFWVFLFLVLQMWTNFISSVIPVRVLITPFFSFFL